MNTQRQSKTPYIIIAIVVLVGLVGYFYWNGTTAPASATLDVTTGGDQVVGAKVYKLLGEINNLKIDSAFFSNASYRTLRDYSVEIPSLPIGRVNPFAPLPGVLVPGASAAH